MKGLMGWKIKMVAGLGRGECLTRGILGSMMVWVLVMSTWRSSVSEYCCIHSQMLLICAARWRAM